MIYVVEVVVIVCLHVEGRNDDADLFVNLNARCEGSKNTKKNLKNSDGQ